MLVEKAGGTKVQRITAVKVVVTDAGSLGFGVVLAALLIGIPAALTARVFG